MGIIRWIFDQTTLLPVITVIGRCSYKYALFYTIRSMRQIIKSAEEYEGVILEFSDQFPPRITEKENDKEVIVQFYIIFKSQEKLEQFLKMISNSKN